MEEHAIDRTIELDDFDGDWDALIEDTGVRREHVLLTRHGRPVLELVQPQEAIQAEQRRADARAKLKVLLEEMREEFADVSDEEHEREVAKAIAQMEWELYGHRSATTPG